MSKIISQKCVFVLIFLAIVLSQTGCSTAADSSALMEASETYTTQADEKLSTLVQSDDMSVQYPDAYKAFSEIYDEYFSVCNGDFVLQWEDSTAMTYLNPIEIEDIYEGTDIT